jgi:alpha-galactosidase
MFSITIHTGGVMGKRLFLIFAVAVIAIMADSAQVFALNNGLARTPPMGFNTWNWFGCRNSSGHGYVNEAMILQIAATFKSKGMAEVGYEYVNIDDCWALGTRNASGGLAPDPQFWPHGLKWLTDSIHRMGLKAGIYSDVGTSTCATCYGGANPQGLPGMQGREQQDCDSFVAWGFDYAKIDFCCHDSRPAVQQYTKVRDCFKAAVTRMKPKVPDAHDILFSICNWGEQSPWLWGDTVGNLWRTTNDIGWQWNSLMAILDKNAPLYPYARIGSWNDPDMLEVGNGDFSTNMARNRSHMSLWCIMASALLAGNDIRSMSDSIRSILINKEVIDVNQDTLGGDMTKGIIQGRRVVSGNSEVWVKLLKGKTQSEYAVCFFNRGNSGAVSISVTTQQITQVGGDMASGKTYKVRDLWRHKDLPDWTAGSNYTTPASVPVNDVFMIRLSLPDVSVATDIKTVAEKMHLDMGGRLVVKVVKSSSVSINIVDLKGAVVYSKRTNGAGDYAINTSRMRSGVYLVKVVSGRESFVQRVMLK